MKPLYKIIILVLVVAFIGGGLLLWWRSLNVDLDSPNQETLRQAQGVTEGVGLEDEEVDLFDLSPPAPPLVEEPLSTSGDLVRVSDQEIFYHWIQPRTGEVFGLTLEGAAYILESGDDVEVSSQTLPTPLRRATLAPGSEKVLGLFGSAEFPQWGIFDSVDGVWRPLPSGIQDATWGEDDGELLVRMDRGGDLSLGFLSLVRDGFPFDTILRDFRLRSVTMHWSPAGKSGRVFFVERPLPRQGSRIWQFDISSERLTLLSQGELGTLIASSPDRTTYLHYSLSNGFRILDENLDEGVPTLITTLPEKCGFSGSDLYCFVPRDDISGDEDFLYEHLKQRVRTTDSLVALGLFDPLFDGLFTSGGELPLVDGIRPLESKGDVYFLNRYDGHIYRYSD